MSRFKVFVFGSCWCRFCFLLAALCVFLFFCLNFGRFLFAGEG